MIKFVKGNKVKGIALALALSMVLTVSGCGKEGNVSKEETSEKITVAYQYGLAYAPLVIMQEQGLIEKHFDGDIEVEWLNLNSGSAINEGFASGEIDVAGVGVGPFVTGVTAGIPYKLYGTIAAQPHAIMTNNSAITSVKDITSENKIALVNLGSFQHIVLAMLAEKELGDAHALDNNIVAMSHPDGMSALLAGSVDCQLTTAPYIAQELQNDGISKVEGIESVWPEGNAFILGLVSNDCYENKKEAYDAIVAATQEAMDYINNNKEEAAAILAEKQEVDKEDMLEWMNDPACVYDMHLDGVMDFAEFMERAGFIEEAPESFESITTESARQEK